MKFGGKDWVMALPLSQSVQRYEQREQSSRTVGNALINFALFFRWDAGCTKPLVEASSKLMKIGFRRRSSQHGSRPNCTCLHHHLEALSVLGGNSSEPSVRPGEFVIGNPAVDGGSDANDRSMQAPPNERPPVAFLIGGASTSRTMPPSASSRDIDPTAVRCPRHRPEMRCAGHLYRFQLA